MDSIGAAYQSALQLEIQTHEARGDDLFDRVTPQILLLHANDVGTAQWDRLFTWLAQAGHRFATADEVLADSAFTVTHAYVGPYGPGLWDRLTDERRRTTARAGIERFFTESAAAWNRGDLDAFCSHYAEDALFVSPNGETRGRDKVLERYRKRYGTDPASMGKLSFEIVELRLSSGTEITMFGGTRPAAIQTASTVARWKLVYPDKESSGLTLLVLRPAPGGRWQVIQDASF
jgi:ketosteroid isomerase-like protein